MASSGDEPIHRRDAPHDDGVVPAVRDLWALPEHAVDVDASTPQGAALLDRWAGPDSPDELIPAGLDDGLDDAPTLAAIGAALRARSAGTAPAPAPAPARRHGARAWRPREVVLVTVGLLLSGLASGWLFAGAPAPSDPVDGGAPQIRIVSNGPAACPMWTAPVSGGGQEPPGGGCFAVG